MSIDMDMINVKTHINGNVFRKYGLIYIKGQSMKSLFKIIQVKNISKIIIHWGKKNIR